MFLSLISSYLLFSLFSRDLCLSRTIEGQGFFYAPSRHLDAAYIVPRVINVSPSKVTRESGLVVNCGKL